MVSFQAVQVLADENLGLYHDREATDPVTELEFRVPNIPGAPRESRPELVYIVNHSQLRLALIEPCRAVISGGQRIGVIGGAIFDLDGNSLGKTCDRPGVQLAPGEMVQAWGALRDIDPNLAVADYPFVAVVGAIGVPTPIQPPAGMVSWWPGDGNTQDIVDGNHGTLQNDATFAAGMVREAFSFDGTGDFVQIAQDTFDSLIDVTVDAWVKFNVLDSLSHRPVGELTNTGVGAMGLKRGRPVQFHWPLVGPQKGRLPLLVPWGLGPAPRGLATAP